MQLTDIGVLKSIISKYGFTFSKSLGQNFLINPTVCPKMAQNSGADKSTGVIEIGPGVGVLTRELAAVSKKVVCIELDSRLIQILDETLADLDNVKVINADALKTDFAALIEEHFPGDDVVVCANLPYYITTPVIMYLLESQLKISSLTLMLQKEAATRICAQPGSRDAGAVSLAVRYWGEPKVLFNVPRGSFMPAPNVDSAVIRIDIHQEPIVTSCSRKAFFKIVKAAFSMRRKTILNCISEHLRIPKSTVSQLLENSGIPSNSRAEQLSLKDFETIAATFESAGF